MVYVGRFFLFFEAIPAIRYNLLLLKKNKRIFTAIGATILEIKNQHQS
jgi:hypothetical protein